jgi:hypothetical protein
MIPRIGRIRQAAVMAMFERAKCPECAGWDTERVFVDWWKDEVRETRICNDCPCQYTISYGVPRVEIDEVPA